MRKRLIRFGVAAAIAYVVIVIVMLSLETTLLFPATPAAAHWRAPPSRDVRDVELTAADGNRIHAWWLPAPGAAGAVLYCHGNAGNLSHRGEAILDWRGALGESVLIFDYPGYGKSTGRPSEVGCYAAADAAYDWLVKEQRVAPERIILFGKSLGGGVATELASRRVHRALVLAKTFTSAPDAAQAIYPWLPARWLMRNRFDSLAKIGRCRRPIFIAHNARDELISSAFGERLYAAAGEPKRYFLMEAGDHNSPFEDDFFEALKAFLAEVEPAGGAR